MQEMWNLHGSNRDVEGGLFGVAEESCAIRESHWLAVALRLASRVFIQLKSMKSP